MKDNTCEFTLWAPFAQRVNLVLREGNQEHPLEKEERGYWRTRLSGIEPGAYYKFRLDQEQILPDPASCSQPEGVHSWSKLIDQRAFQWSDDIWIGLPISEMIIYELHVGTFTPEGTFEAVIEKLGHLQELGINTLEIMPVAQFPGARNWGYDGVYPFAVQHSYGGAEGLKKLVDACHRKKMAVILDVVYNHVGPEGNYLRQYGPYFTDKYHTPWGSALNFDDAYSDEVRNFFLQNAVMWLEDFHFDGLRLDAVHEIIDRGTIHFLKELRQCVDDAEERTGRGYVLIAETDLNDTRMVQPYETGGHGLDGHWVDDFHHSLHTLLTGEGSGYYGDYGEPEHLARSFRQGYAYDGRYSEFRKRRVGSDPAQVPPFSFVTCIQNHDQVGNRMLGERITQLLSFEAVKLSAGLLLSAPFTPLLFMGEEFGEDRPFQYFVSHGDPDLVKAVREGRKREFNYFFEHHRGEFPDPQSRETFNNSRLNWNFMVAREKKFLYDYYRELIRLRKAGAFHAFRNFPIHVETEEVKHLIHIRAGEEGSRLLAVVNYGKESVESGLPDQGSRWRLLVASADKNWGGPIEFPERFPKDGRVELLPESIIICQSGPGGKI